MFTDEPADPGGNTASPDGNSSARWEQIWAHRTLLLRVARRHGADANDAEDAVQEAMLRAAVHPDIADNRLQAWLVAVTTRLCMDRHRRRASEARRWQRLSGQAPIPQPGQLPEEQVCERAEAAWTAARADELLPPRQAQALRLSAAGCDVRQVASELGVPYRAAESLLARARRTLRAALTAGAGALVWAWRAPAATAGNPVSLALASAATVVAVSVATAPLILSLHELPGGFWTPVPERSHHQPLPSSDPSYSATMTPTPGETTSLTPLAPSASGQPGPGSATPQPSEASSSPATSSTDVPPGAPPTESGAGAGLTPPGLPPAPALPPTPGLPTLIPPPPAPGIPTPPRLAPLPPTHRIPAPPPPPHVPTPAPRVPTSPPQVPRPPAIPISPADLSLQPHSERDSHGPHQLSSRS